MTPPEPYLPSWRRLPIGAEPAPDGGVHFRVWAPRRRSVELIRVARPRQDAAPPTPTASVALIREPGDDGYYSALVPDAHEGTAYLFRLDGEGSFPDPASRWQPDGPHGPSVVIDPSAFAWTDDDWHGPTTRAPVLYEMHVGTFTTDGTWRAAAAELPALADIGITCIEVMPVAEFSGRWGWGYDGVNLFAPFHHYGTPDDFRAFVNRAHMLGVGVILDVVYNHLGPDGNYLREFSESYFAPHHTTDWGEAINFDDDADSVRELAIANGRYWITEFHLDGLRLDATQNIYDTSSRHVLAELTTAVRAAAGARRIYLTAENEPQNVQFVRAAQEGGHGLDSMWNDDWHHTVMVALAGRDEAYYTDYTGSASELVSAAKHGFLYQGQWYSWQHQPRGTISLGLPPDRFVHFMQNHDQLANSLRGDRLHRVASPPRIRALTALLLLGPQTPMIFQGQEYGATSPFLYFADHHAELMQQVRKGREIFLGQFQSLAAPEVSACVADPGAAETFRLSKLHREERTRNAEVVALHRDLITIRREDPVFAHPRRGGVDGSALRDDALVLRFFGANDSGDDRLLLINLGGPLHLTPMPEPLLAPSALGPWTLRWTSEAPEYGGLCTPPYDSSMRDWYLSGSSAVMFAPANSPSIPREVVA